MDLMSSLMRDKKFDEAENKKARVNTVNVTVPKTIKDKVKLAESMSLEVYKDVMDRLELIKDVEKLHTYINKAIKNGELAIDTETNGLDRIDGKIAGVCLYTPGENGVYIPLGHISYMTNNPLKDNISTDIMREELQRCKDADVKFILHNAKFDMHILYWMVGIKIIPYWDTLIGSQLLNENEPHGLKVLYQKYIVGNTEDKKVASFNSLFKGIEFNKIPPHIAYMYAAFDPIMTYELYKFQFNYLDKQGEYCYSKGLEKVAEVFRTIEMPLIEVVFEMECTGVKIDENLADELLSKYKHYEQVAVDKFKKEVDKMAGDIARLQISSPDKYMKLCNNGVLDVNIGSSTQIAILLYDVLHFVSPNKKSPRGTGEEILKTYKHPIVESILEYRGMSKLISTYIQAIPDHISYRTGRLHANFNQYGAKTGRFSSSDPNLQNIPSRKKKLGDGTIIDAGHDIRQMFIADPGMVIVGGDFSQQEPRCLAHMSGDKHMIDAYLEGKDLYGTIASKIYKMPYEECLEFRPDGTVNPAGKDRRSSVKPILLGIMYGRGVASIAEQMNITPEEAKKIISDFYDEFPKVQEFVQYTQEFASDYGFVQTAWGRKRRLPDMLLDPIEITKCIKPYSDTFDPLAFSAEELLPEDDEVPDKIYYKYARLMSKAYGRQQKEDIKNLALKEGYLITDNSAKIADAQRQCVNSVIQGSAADMTKLAMITIYNDDELNKLGYKLIIPVHDEVLGICPRENAKAVAARLEYIMIHIVDGIFEIPMKTDIEITERWYGEPIKL